VATPRRKATKLVALSSAGVVAVYAAGFYRTKAAADRLAEADAHRQRPEVAPVDPAPQPPQAQPVTFALPTRPAPDRQPSGAPTPVITQAQQARHLPAADAGEAAKPAPETAPVVVVEPTAPVADTSTSPAATPIEQPVTPQAPTKPLAQYKDGTYLGWGSCRHGDIQASVTIAGGRIAETKIAQCWTRYSCSWIDPVVPQVVARQSPNVDYVSGATQSVDAFYWAVVDALSKAK